MKLCVCFLWHMHQPYYKDPESGTYILPWVRLHAVKDYVALPRIFRGFPAVRHTFNLVPSLLLQIRDYVENGATDTFLDLSRRNALDLERHEEEFLLRNFFSAFPPTMIMPQRRYADLYRRREAALRAVGRQNAPGQFGASDYTDLAVLFNLTWFHPLHREEDRELSRLWGKGGGFTEREKQYVLDRQIDLMAAVVPEYLTLSGKDGGELSTSPMFHPILPLLVDSASAREAAPGAALPRTPFAFPEDAEAQVRRGRDFTAALFGAPPRGLWPSEGSISPIALAIAARAGFHWAATDEMLLSRALGKPISRDGEGVPSDPSWVYHPYLAPTAAGPIHVFFRDHQLSDLIGFEYARWDAGDAARHFVHRIGRIRERLARLPRGERRDTYVVPVILDGENAWEYFSDSGTSFLRQLLEGLSRLAPDVACTTFSDALDRLNYEVPLPSIPTGSWIDGTFGIWIGHPEDHAAWELLSAARTTVKQLKERTYSPGESVDGASLERAMQHLLIAEGSDWCWWYGDEHFTPHAPEFDRLFRNHVKAAYKELGINYPDRLDIPIVRPERMPSERNLIAAPRDYINPTIDGRLTSYFEWNLATPYHPSPEHGAMHRAGHGILNCFYYGFGKSELFFRMDFREGVFETPAHLEVDLVFPRKNAMVTIRIAPDEPSCRFAFGRIDDVGETGPTTDARASGMPARDGLAAAYNQVLEVAVPFERLSCADEERIEFFLTVGHVGTLGERWPTYGSFKAELPGQDFRERMWEV